MTTTATTTASASSILLRRLLQQRDSIISSADVSQEQYTFTQEVFTTKKPRVPLTKHDISTISEPQLMAHLLDYKPTTTLNLDDLILRATPLAIPPSKVQHWFMSVRTTTLSLNDEEEEPQGSFPFLSFPFLSFPLSMHPSPHLSLCCDV
jgi:hypothetical protein